MTFHLQYLKDVIGNNYIGISVPYDIIQPYLHSLKSILSDNFDIYTQNQRNRDSNKHHITVINVADYNRLSKEMGIDKFINSLELIFDYEIDDLEMPGIGTAEKNGNRTFFVVCKSEKLNAIRQRYNLPEFDFHITLGFKDKDVFGVRKDEIIKNFL